MIENEPIKAQVLLWEDAVEMYQHIESLMANGEKILKEDVVVETNNPTIKELLEESKVQPEKGLSDDKMEESIGPCVEEVDESLIDQNENSQTIIPSVEEVFDEPSVDQHEIEQTIIPLIEEVFAEPSIDQFKKKEILYENV